MIIVNLTGGLGNQMFQYVFGRYLSIKHKTLLKYHFTNALFNTQRRFELDVFNIKTAEASSEDLQKFGIIQNRVLNRLFYLFDERCGIQFNKHIMTQRYPYTFNSNYLTIKDNSYIQGYWADERYFKNIENIIRKEFTPKEKLDEKNQKILEKIQKTNSVSIHVRRGDYVTNKTGPKFIGLDYYKNATKNIEKKVKNSVFFVFSDDIPWCKKNLDQFFNDAHYINYNTEKNSYKDLILMSACKHNIIANSSFSWWGGWLNINLNKIVIKS